MFFYFHDNFIIINDDYRTVGYTPPSGIVTDPTQYHQSQLDPTIALNGQGQWLYVNGVRYWSPYVYLIGNEDDWSPYRHGYWTMDSSHQTVTWISFDPWGWMTDHYGFWRFHGVYGWLWAPFAGSDFVYHAHCATWIDDGSANVGWFPYFNSYAYGYRDGADQGFADGFWLGYKVGANYGQSGYAYHPGFTIVPVGQFTQGDIDSVYLHINNNPLVVMVVAQASTSNYFAAAPRTQILSKLGIIPNTSLSTGSAGLQYAVAIHSIPPRYTQVIATISTARNAPVGSVIDARGAATVNLILPTINGRGVAMAPIGRDSQGQVATLPPQTVRVAVANPNNPVVITRTNATPPVPPVGSSTNHPVLQNPTRPTPAPTTTPRPTMTPYNASKFSMLSILKDQQHQ